jgi:hypothetical protein
MDGLRVVEIPRRPGLTLSSDPPSSQESDGPRPSLSQNKRMLSIIFLGLHLIRFSPKVLTSASTRNRVLAGSVHIISVLAVPPQQSAHQDIGFLLLIT